MERKDRLNQRLDKIVQKYRKLARYEKSGFKGIMKTGSLKSPISLVEKDLVKCDKSGHEIKDKLSNNYPSPFGINNGVVPQNNELCSDSRPCYKISSDEQNDNMDRRNSSSYSLNYKSGRNMERKDLIDNIRNKDNGCNAKMLLEPFNNKKVSTSNKCDYDNQEAMDEVMDDIEVIDLTNDNDLWMDLESQDECQDNSFILNKAPLLHFIKTIFIILKVNLVFL